MNWFEGKKLVVPIDFGEQSKDAVDTALTMVNRTADIHVIHVAPDLETIAPEVVWQEISDETRRQSIEKAFREEFSDTKYQGLTFHACFGDAGRQITHYAEEIAAGVIVMPSHGRTGFKRLLLGSVAERVLRLAHCPVLVLKS